MIYSNDDPMAILAMEIARTDNYGEYDSYDGETVCPVSAFYGGRPCACQMSVVG